MAIDGTQKVLDFVESIADALKQSTSDDGKIDWKDLPNLILVLVKFPAAREGAKTLKEELSNLSQEDIQILITRLSAIIIKYREAFKPIPTVVTPVVQL